MLPSHSKANINSMNKPIRIATYVCGFLSIFLLGCADPTKSPAEHSSDTAALKKVIPDLEAQLVTRFRYQDGTKALNYMRGQFAEGANISQTPRSSVPFDSTARSDLESLWATIRAMNTGVFLIEEATYDSAGRLTHAEFRCSKGNVSQRYVYEPGYTLPADMSRERWHTRIDNNWYYRRDDWN